MNLLQESSLPACLKKFDEASVQVYSLVVDTAPDFALCNLDGYLLEIKGEKIVNSLILKEVGQSINCFYFCENEKPFIFYVVLTSEDKLFLIKRLDSHLEIIKIYEDVTSYKVDDFESLGYPQLKICKTTNDYIVKFPTLHTQAVVDQLEFETNVNSIAKLLAEKLQIVCRHVDELTAEWHNMKRLLQFNNYEENFSLIPLASVEFSIPLEECAKEITILSSWIKMIADELVFGFNILYNGEKEISGLEFKMCGKVIKEYSYRFFPYDDSDLDFEDNPLFSCEKFKSSILPGQKITVVGGALICFHNSFFERELQISCYLSSDELKNNLMRKTYEMNISDLFNYSKNFFRSLKKNCSAEDLKAIKTVKSETKFKIKLKNYVNETLESMLRNNLGFEQVKFQEDNLYYCNSKYLSDVFIASQTPRVTEDVWKFNFYTSNETQIYFFVNILYELLPEYTSILLDEDYNDVYI